jgi:Polyketide cyclase / dehydrase and lipid transport
MPEERSASSAAGDSAIDPATIRWPERYHPSRATIHVSNQLVMPATPAAIWPWLVRAPIWPSWYPNSRSVRLEGGGKELAPGARFTWWTFGVSLRSTVLEFIPPERIAWDGQALGVDAYHAWLIRPRAGGSLVVTEETQYGLLARLNSILFPTRMHRLHQLWLEQLSRVARDGPPP